MAPNRPSRSSSGGRETSLNPRPERERMATACRGLHPRQFGLIRFCRHHAEGVNPHRYRFGATAKGSMGVSRTYVPVCGCVWVGPQLPSCGRGAFERLPKKAVGRRQEIGSPAVGRLLRQCGRSRVCKPAGPPRMAVKSVVALVRFDDKRSTEIPVKPFRGLRVLARRSRRVPGWAKRSIARLEGAQGLEPWTR